MGTTQPVCIWLLVPFPSLPFMWQGILEKGGAVLVHQLD